MRYEFTLPCKAFSINQAFYATKKVKTAACRAWERSIFEYLEGIYEMMNFQPVLNFEGEAHLYLEFVYPESVFRNKLGHISARTYDLSNIEKLFIDVLFGQFLGINDKNITQLISVKSVGPAYAIKVVLELNPYSDTNSSFSLGTGSDK